MSKNDTASEYGRPLAERNHQGIHDRLIAPERLAPLDAAVPTIVARALAGSSEPTIEPRDGPIAFPDNTGLPPTAAIGVFVETAKTLSSDSAVR